MSSMSLLTFGNAKILKGEAFGYLTAIMHLAPAWVSGRNTCAGASVGCAAACLFTAGRGIYQRTRAARIRKTNQFFDFRVTFMAELVADIRAVVRKATREGMTPAIRLNGTSDIRWETVALVVDGVEYPNIMAAFPNVQFYDYTKLSNRRGIPANYHLTFSRSENNDAAVTQALRNGMNVAVVFYKVLPRTWKRRKVVDGVATDLRFLDPARSIVGLVAKGKGRRDDSGFVIRAA